MARSRAKAPNQMPFPGNALQVPFPGRSLVQARSSTMATRNMAVLTGSAVCSVSVCLCMCGRVIVIYSKFVFFLCLYM